MMKTGFPSGYSKADCELIYSGRYSPNLLAAAFAVARLLAGDDPFAFLGVKTGVLLA